MLTVKFHKIVNQSKTMVTSNMQSMKGVKADQYYFEITTSHIPGISIIYQKMHQKQYWKGESQLP